MEPYKTKFNQKREYAALQSFKERLKCDRHWLETYGSIVISYPTNQKFSEDVIVRPL